jgi:hypothetical protein
MDYTDDDATKIWLETFYDDDLLNNCLGATASCGDNRI